MDHSKPYCFTLSIQSNFLCNIFWVTNKIDRYIVEFVVENYQSFMKVEEIFKKGPCGRILKGILFWIKMLIEKEWSLSFSMSLIDVGASTPGHVLVVF